MKEKLHIIRHLFTLSAALFLMLGLISHPAQAAGQTAGVSVNRSSGVCTYTVQGLDPGTNSSMTLQVSRRNNTAAAYQENIALTAENCPNGTYTGSFTLKSLNGIFDEYNVNILVGDSVFPAGTCDFSLHTGNLSMKAEGGNADTTRTITVTSSVPAGDVVIPGEDKQVYVAAWPEGSDENNAKTIALKTPFIEGNMTFSANIAQAGTAYGKWNAKLVLDNGNSGTPVTLATSSYHIAPILKTFLVQKSKALEKKKSFAVNLDGLKNAYGIKKVRFQVYNSKGKKVTTVTGTSKKADGSRYYSEISLKKLNYLLDLYTIKAVLTDQNNNTQTLEMTALADERIQSGTLSVARKKNASCLYKLTNPYIPGNIKKVRFVLYQVNGKKLKKQASYNVTGTSGKKKITLKVPNEEKGKYKLQVYGFTSWGKKILLNEETYRLRKKDMGKNGWFYEKYAGKTYKFYYVNNKKQIDLTDILGLKKSSSTNSNRLYIEVNRAASAVTIYLYNEETKKYDIPIKTCSVSVGRDTWTNAGTGGLNEDSSYTPLGTYSICTNGQSVKYTLKPMLEPDGQTLYARWASHIVGNVYFHAIAVGTQSHYALPSSTYNRLGSPASAGCIRMTVADAKWIYDYAPAGTTVKIVKGSTSKPGPLGKAPVIKTTGGINYDPTDPGVPDSRKKADYKAKRISGYMTKKGKKVGY